MALPVNGSTHLIPAYYSIYPPRKDERLSWPIWLTYSGWLTHISGHPSAASVSKALKAMLHQIVGFIILVGHVIVLLYHQFWHT